MAVSRVTKARLRQLGWFGVGWMWMACGGDGAASAPGGGVGSGGQQGPASGSTGQPPSDPPSAVPCDVQAVLESHCLDCHGATPSFGATVALASWSDFHAASFSEPERARYAVAAERIGEADPGRQMPPPSRPALPEQARGVLEAWLAAGAPASSERCEGSTEPPDAGDVDVSGLDCYKLLAHAEGDETAKYPVGVANDTYVNFAFAAPWGDKTAYAVVARPVIDNKRALHHWLLFQEHGGVTDGDVSSSSGSHPTGELIHGWAPGGTPLDFRKYSDDVGFEFPTGTSFVVEMHYNSMDASAQDASGVEICVQDRKPENLAGVSWLGTDLILGARSVQGTCDPTSSQPIHILGISPHMHLQGRHMTATIQRSDGSSEVLHDAPFDFENQTWYEREVVLNPGDTITTRCDYATEVSFGKETTAEMCYLFTVAYPKGALSDGGLVGTFAHGGGACLGL